MPKTFILGVGAQKSGTTWLHHYLKQQPNADLGFTKEYKVWHRRKKLRNLLIGSSTEKKIWLMQRIPWLYFYYFSSLLKRPGIDITGDITPAYAMLNRRQLQEIKSRFERRGIKVKVVFLMRDPVERIISSVAHHNRTGEFGKQSDYSDIIVQRAVSRAAALRTDYKGTITEVESVFQPADIYYGIFEELFEPDSINKLSDFLCVPPDPNLAQDRVNASDKIEFNDSVRAQLADYYKDVYEFASERFPQTRHLWRRRP